MDDVRLIHPDREQLESFVHGRLDEETQLSIEQHITKCDSCCDVLRSIPHDALVAQIRDGDTSQEPGQTELMVGRPGNTKSDQEIAEIPQELFEHPRYRIIKKLGFGGMGVVYQAEHRLMERPVALKVINARLVNSDVAIERFRLEVKAAAKLAHRNIVAAHDAEQAGDLHFLVMEFIEGTDLSELIRQRGKLSVLHACNYVMQAAQGLQHALEKGMVHRDIKPHNLMRTPKGTIKILDFGLARFASQQSAQVEDGGLTGDGTTLGTPDYIAPEQARDSRRADIRADIYSLGCTLYYLLAGQPPYPSGSAIEKVVAHFEKDPVPLSELRQDIPPELIRIIARMMAKDPAERFQTPMDVVGALRPFGKPGDSAPESAAAETNLAASTANPATHETYVDCSPTLEPLEQLDLSAFPTAEIQPMSQLPNQYTKPASKSDWRSLLFQYRAALVAGGVGLIILIAGFALLPGLSGIFSKFAGGSPDTIPGPVEDTDWIDLLKQIETNRQVVAGQWRKSDNELLVEAAQGARLELPYKPPEEYDFEVTFTRHSGTDSIALHFVAGSGQASFDIDGWGEHLAGIQNIDERTIKDNSSRVENQQLTNGRTYTAMVRVRRGRVDAFLDGKQLTSYEGDGSNLSMLDLWMLPNSQVLGIGAYNSATTFHRIRVRPAR